MADETQFTIGAKAGCSDGPCGEVRRMIVDPATDTVTHLVIEPWHGRHPGRLVREHVHALDGEIGRVQGLLIDPGDHRVTHVLLREGIYGDASNSPSRSAP